MKRELFIIHPSDIVRKGLHAILRNAADLDITLLKDTGQLSDFSDMAGSCIIVITPLPDNDDMKFLSVLKKQNQMYLVCISEAPWERDLPAGVDRFISLDSSGDDCLDLIRELADSLGDEDENTSRESELTVRETDVLRLVALGHSNKEIADKLFISVHTVISHRKNVTEKLGIKSISGLTVYAILNKIIDPDLIDPDQLI